MRVRRPSPGNHARRSRLRAAPLWVALALSLLVGDAHSRPGGGQTYSGSRPAPSSPGYGGQSGGEGELFRWLLYLVVRHPKVGVPAIVLFAAWTIYSRKKQRAEQWDSERAPARAPRPLAVGQELEKLRALDPGFSRVLFEDFAYRLFAAAHSARHAPAQLAALAPYLAPDVRRQLAAMPPLGAPVTAVAIGSFRIVRVNVPDASKTDSPRSGQVHVDMTYEANLSTGGSGQELSAYVVESWVVSRSVRAQTKTPTGEQAFGCPNCAAPFESSSDQRCGYCGEVVGDGRFDWQVCQRSVLANEARPAALTRQVAESGTHLPTVREPHLAQRWASLCSADPNVTESGLAQRTRLIYERLNQAWTSHDLLAARGFLSDNMFEYLSYWVQAYASQGLRNRLENMRMTRHELVKVIRDAHFDAVTLRIWATGLDYTVNETSNALLSGSRSTEREYAEYWTLIRGAGVQGEAQTRGQCPKCAAPLEVNQAGACNYCGAHVTRGEFDWVLSKIEQDESYRG